MSSPGFLRHMTVAQRMLFYIRRVVRSGNPTDLDCAAMTPDSQASPGDHFSLFPAGRSPASPELPAVRTALAMIGKFGITASLSIIYVYSAEVFPTVIRSAAPTKPSFLRDSRPLHTSSGAPLGKCRLPSRPSCRKYVWNEYGGSVSIWRQCQTCGRGPKRTRLTVKSSSRWPPWKFLEELRAESVSSPADKEK